MQACLRGRAPSSVGLVACLVLAVGFLGVVAATSSGVAVGAEVLWARTDISASTMVPASQAG
jgi:autotransporter translocation and assembly factor TamB